MTQQRRISPSCNPGQDWVPDSPTLLEWASLSLKQRAEWLRQQEQDQLSRMQLQAQRVVNQFLRKFQRNPP